MTVEENEKELEKRREESRRIQEHEVPAGFHYDIHGGKGNEHGKKDVSHRKKKTYASVVKGGTKQTNVCV